MSAEITPAVERVMQEINAGLGPAEPKFVPNHARSVLAAALDVEEMARAMVDHRRIPPYNEDVAHCSCGDSYDTRVGAAEHVAAAIRTALLGADS